MMKRERERERESLYVELCLSVDLSAARDIRRLLRRLMRLGGFVSNKLTISRPPSIFGSWDMGVPPVEDAPHSTVHKVS